MSRAKNSQIIVVAALETPTLQQVLTEGNTASTSITLGSGKAQFEVQNFTDYGKLNSNSVGLTYRGADTAYYKGISLDITLSGNVGEVIDYPGLSIQNNGNFITALHAILPTESRELWLPNADGALLVLSDIITAPTSSTDTGSKGEVRIVGTTRYECIATDTWVKSTVVITF